MYDVGIGSVFREFLEPGMYWRKKMPDLKHDLNPNNLMIVEFDGDVTVQFCGGPFSGGTYRYDAQEFVEHHVPDMRVPETAQKLFYLFGVKKIEHKEKARV